MRINIWFYAFFVTACLNSRVETNLGDSRVRLRIQLPYLNLDQVSIYRPSYVLSGCVSSSQTGVKDGPHSVMFVVEKEHIQKISKQSCRFVINAAEVMPDLSREWLEEPGKLLEDSAVSVRVTGGSGLGIVQSNRFLLVR